MTATAGLAARYSPTPLWRVAAMFAVVTAILYGNSLETPFLLDDQYLHSREPAMRSPAAALSSPLPRRLGMLSFALNYHWHGLWFPGYHVVNLAIHGLAATFLFGLLRGTLARCVGRADSAASERVDLWAGLIALVWLIHPLQTGSVTYVIQRFESLMGLFVLISLYAVMRAANVAAVASSEGRETPEAQEDPPPPSACLPRPAWRAAGMRAAGMLAAGIQAATWRAATWRAATWRAAGWQAAAVAAAFAASATKEVAVVLPLLALAYDRVYWAGSWAELARKRVWLHAGLLSAALSVVYHSSPALSGAIESSAGFNVPGMTWWQYLRSQPEVLLRYLWLAVWPGDLCFDYNWPVANSFWRIYPAGLMVVGLLSAAAWLMMKAPRIGFLGIAFFTLLAPTSSFMPLMDLAFEHRMYLPLAPLLAALALALEQLLERWLPCPTRRRAALVVGAAIVCSALGTRTFLRNRDYADPLRMWESVVEANPNGSRGHLMYALQLTAIGRLEEAETHYRRSLELRKDMPEALVGMGYVRMKQGKFDEAERLFRLGVEHPRTNHVAHFNLGKLRERQARLSHALDHYRWSVAAQADYIQAWESMASVAGKLGKTRVEIEALRHVRSINPHASEPSIRLARLLLRADEREGGDPAEALQVAGSWVGRRGVEQRAVLECVAAAQLATGQLEAARATADQALRLPGDTAGRRTLEAIRRAERPGPLSVPERIRR